MFDASRSVRRLVFLLPPLGFYFAAGILFEFSVDSGRPFIDQIMAITKNVGAWELQHDLAEEKARFVWLAAALLSIVVPVAAICFSIMTIHSRVARISIM